MSKGYFLFILMIIPFSSFAQTTKAYITSDGRYSGDPKNAVSYVLIQKLAGDSAYLVSQYNMHDTILSKGFYKDEMLTIPSGKFTYYKKPNSQADKINYGSDTNNYVEKVGYFSNGKATGTWREYTYNKKLSKEYHFENGALNGPYITYYNDYSGKWAEVNVINDQYEGKYDVYTVDSVLIEESIYEHSKLLNKKIHIYEASPPEVFFPFLERKLKKYQLQLSKENSLYAKITIDTTGHVLNAELIKSINPEIDKAIIAALIQSPAFTPAIHDGTRFVQTMVYPLILFHEEENRKFEDYMIKNMHKLK